ncbi:hypothetical protein EJB05_48544, partial [Eragrostis curvula]
MDAVRPLSFWNHWATQILVLLSLGFQVPLLLLAGTRRREAHAVVKFLLWLAYQLADTTATYAIGHLSVSSVPQEHRLVAFWAPFLVLHLGGPDNIGAYALEDSSLWLRHFQGFVVQVLGAGYVVYKHIAGSDPFLLVAAIVMSILGFVKYAERVLAIKYADLESIRSYLKEEAIAEHQHFNPMDIPSVSSGKAAGADQDETAGADQDEIDIRRAHSMFHICKHAMVDSWLESDLDLEMLKALKLEPYKDMWTLMELELSLMYDILYTKAAMIYTWHGYCIRAGSSLATAASFLLFQFSDKRDHSRVDVAVTYTLLAGAFLLETVSLLSALGSSWTYSFLCTTGWSWIRYAALCSGRWDRFRWLVRMIKQRVSNRSTRRWSGKMGQYNMLYFSSIHGSNARVRLFVRLAAKLGQKEWWIRYHYSRSVHISKHLKPWLFYYVRGLDSKGKLSTMGLLNNGWAAAMELPPPPPRKSKRRNLRGGAVPASTKRPEHPPELVSFYECLNQYRGDEFQDAIIVLHIATDVFLAKSSRVGGSNPVKINIYVEEYHGNLSVPKEDLVVAIRTLSNYMMFLLVDRPYMLPGPAQSMLYRRTRKNLSDVGEKLPERQDSMYRIFKDLFGLHDDPKFASFRDELAKTLLAQDLREDDRDKPRLFHAKMIAEALIGIEGIKGSDFVLNLLLNVWMHYLVFAANRCSRESHAKKLSNGGELTTILWLMQDHFHQESNLAQDDDTPASFIIITYVCQPPKIPSYYKDNSITAPEPKKVTKEQNRSNPVAKPGLNLIE